MLMYWHRHRLCIIIY